MGERGKREDDRGKYREEGRERENKKKTEKKNRLRESERGSVKQLYTERWQ